MLDCDQRRSREEDLVVGEKTKLQEMLEKKEKIRQGGGEKKVAKQHGAGKLTARERIDLLFDPGTFQELSLIHI